MPPASRPRHGAFVDETRAHLKAGKGGRGAVSFRREPYVPRGGPNGGDGGRGGSIVLVASPEVSSLHSFTRRPEWKAEDGRPGQGGLKHGSSGADLRLPVPVGTIVIDEESGDVVGDLGEPGAELVAARGGAGGRGNVHFKSPTHQAPQVSEPGLPGEDRWVRLELKLIADVGLVGPPNAGKSSLLSAITAATPKVGDYPFTTLDPELGVADLSSGSRLVMADIPGLIEGAAQGIGLGHRFLRHIERTRALVYLVDGASADPWGDLRAVQAEVRAYSEELAERPSLIAVNKLDLPQVQELRAAAGRDDVLWLSALTGEGVPELMDALSLLVAAAPEPPRVEVAPRPVRLRRTASPPQVNRRPWGFEVTGESVERLVRRTDFDSGEGLEWFQVQLDRLGVSSALEDAGAEPGDTVRIGELEFEYQP
jgi:GTPase